MCPDEPGGCPQGGLWCGEGVEVWRLTPAGAPAHMSLRCPSIPRPTERRWQVLLCRGLAAEWDPAVRPGSWPGSMVLPCRQCLGWSREATVMPCGGIPAQGVRRCRGAGPVHWVPGCCPTHPGNGV